MHYAKYIFLSCLLVFATAVPAQQASPTLTPTQQLARDILKELVEINTTDTPEGNVTTAAEAMAARFRKAGFPEADLKVLGPILLSSARSTSISTVAAPLTSKTEMQSSRPTSSV